MRNKLGFFLGIRIILLCLIVIFSSCKTQKAAAKTQKYVPKDSTTITTQMIIVDSLGIIWVLPAKKGLKL
jgi:hypothetical protein